MDDFEQIKPDVETKSTSEEGSFLIPKVEVVGDTGGNRNRRSILATIKMKNIWRKKWSKPAIFVLAFLFTLTLVGGFLSYRVYKKALVVKASIDQLQQSVDEQDLAKIKDNLQETQKQVGELKSTYRTILWMRLVPFVSGYVSDGQHGINAAGYGLEAADIFIAAVEPYADIIGFDHGGTNTTSSQETTQDRIDFIVKTIPQLTSKSDELIAKVELVRDEVDKINPDRYPKTFRGRAVQEKVIQAKELVDSSSELVINSKPLLEVAPYLLGVDSERTYLLLFQNDKELRPTGGFMTAYSIAKVNKGKFQPVSSSDMYTLDSFYTPAVPAPEPLRKYIKGPYTISKNYRLRDMNWDPDFRNSMELFTKEAESAGVVDIDGVIAVDTQLLVNILDVLDEINVPGYGLYSNDPVQLCDCPQVVYELENFADVEGPIVWSENEPGKIVYAPANYDDRKKIIGPMMNVILADTLSLPNNKFPALFKAITDSILQKHILIYMKDSSSQEAVESFGLAGRVEDTKDDYLYINDANLGGRKSNLYVTQDVKQSIDVTRDGTVTKTLTITYKNPAKYDGWLNSVLPNWVRIYVPQGSKLIEFNGVEDKIDPYEESGKTVFAGFFQLRPLGVSTLSLKYQLPDKYKDRYNILIQKQPGKDKPLYSIKVGNNYDEFFLLTDKKLSYGI
jgi:hypothetical protein